MKNTKNERIIILLEQLLIMINLYENFSLRHDFGLIDIYDIYELFNETIFYDLFEFNMTYLIVYMEHKSPSINKIILYCNDNMHIKYIDNYTLILIIESMSQYIRKQNMT